MRVARARSRGPSLSCFSRFLVNSARSIGSPSAPVRFRPGHPTGIANHSGRPRNLAATFFAATLCMPDSVGSRSGSLQSAPHRSPQAIARLDCYEDVPSDASRDVRCDVLTVVTFSPWRRDGVWSILLSRSAKICGKCNREGLGLFVSLSLTLNMRTRLRCAPNVWPSSLFDLLVRDFIHLQKGFAAAHVVLWDCR